MRRMFFLCLFVFGVRLSVSHAQDTVVLQQVEIYGAESDNVLIRPLSNRKMDTIVLQSQGTSNLSQLLIQNSPVFIKTYGPGSVATASFRGTTASHTLVLWNGLPLNAPSLGQVDFSTIPVFLADDVNLKWGSGTSDNSGGLGGTVNIDNVIGFGKGLILDLKQTAGSFNTWGSFVTAGYGGKRAAFRVKAYRNASDNDFEYENTATIPIRVMRQQNAGFEDYGMMAEMNVLLKNSVIALASWNQWDNRNLPPIMPNVDKTNTDEWSRDRFSRNYVSFKTYWPSGNLQLKSAAFFERQRYFLEVRNPVSDVVVNSINSTNVSMALLQIANLEQHLYGSWRLNAKLQWDDERVVSNHYEGQKRRDVLSAYLAVEGSPFAFANFKVTARHDWVDGKSMGFSPTAAFSYRLPTCRMLSATLGYSQNYRNPSLNDLYWYPGGNESLMPEIGKTLDLALNFKHGFGGLSLSLSSGVYVSRVKNWIQWVPTMFRFWTAENVASVKARGSENHLDMTWVVKDWKFSLSGNYVFTVTTDEGERDAVASGLDKQLIYIPRHHGNLFAAVHWKSWNLSYTLEATGARRTTYGSSYSLLPSYVLHGLALGREMGKFKIVLRCHNLCGASYQNVLWRAMPGRGFEAMVQYKW